VSISTVASHAWTTPVTSQTSINAASNPFPTQPPGVGAAASGQTGSGAGTAATGSSNAFRQLSADIQALLVQAQGGAGNATATTTPPGQKLATDLQSLLSQLQSGQAAGSASAQPATGQAQGHSRHHRHDDGASAGVNTAAATTGSSLVTSESGTSAARSERTVSQAFAADILQAFRAYAGTASATGAVASAA
jgi:hypothetical protein